jgi:glycosyltransferase involved in cell wall biosynthesis
VASVRAQTVAALETIVVVDHNAELLLRIAERAVDITVVPNRRSRGASGARNTGVEVAHGEVVAFLDDDAHATPGWIAELQGGFAGAAVLGVGGSIVPDWLGTRPRWFPSEFFWVLGCTYTGLPEEDSPVRNLIAANMAVRRDAFEELEGFRSDFGKQGDRAEPEETEFCLRASERWPDRVWLYRPPAEVAHKVPPRRAEWSYFVTRCWYEGRGKARLLHYARRSHALASEKRYVRVVLPRGIVRGVGDAIVRRDVSGLARAGAIVAGLAITAAGYGYGRWEALAVMVRARAGRTRTRSH